MTGLARKKSVFMPGQRMLLSQIGLSHRHRAHASRPVEQKKRINIVLHLPQIVLNRFVMPLMDLLFGQTRSGTPCQSHTYQDRRDGQKQSQKYFFHF